MFRRISRGASSKRLLTAALAAIALGAAAPSADARVMLQYFESRWATIERRMPDVFMAGYGALWLPPAAKADSGGFSVGFDVFDRFDLGSEFSPTLYGTETGLDELIAEAHQAGILVFFDTVYNHNGFSDGYRGDNQGQTPCQLNWAIGEGGYPGFVMSGRDLALPFDLEFRNICPSAQFPLPSCDSDPLNCRIAGLIDIRHPRAGEEPAYSWIRHPAFPDTRNIPYQPIVPTNRRFYPDLDLPSPYDDGWRPFNIASPQEGDPFPEDVNGMLQRYTHWMLEVKRVDGFRLDAVKHTPTWFFNDVYDLAANDRGRDFWGRQVTPFSFGEYVSGSNSELAAYHRRDGFGNRTLLDFPLKFAMNSEIGNPSGNFSALLGSTFDASDGSGVDGSRGVMFVSSHDTGFIGDPPQLDNVAYAYILGRPGFPIVYHNAQEFGDGRNFPNQASRGDAMGRFGNIITTLVNINNNFVNGRSGNGFRSLWSDNDSIFFELNNTLVVALCDRIDRGENNQGYITRTVSNFGFRPGEAPTLRLKEVTGNASDPTVDPDDDIPDFIDIPQSGAISLRVPTAVNKNNVRHDRPYVMYTIAPPDGALTVEGVAFTLPPDPQPVGGNRAQERLTPIDVVQGNSLTLRLQTTLDGGASAEDNAIFRWNYGLNVNGSDNGAFGVDAGVDGLFAGYEDFLTTKSPRATGGTGTYTQTVDLTNPAIKEGFHYIQAVAFLPRLSGLPPIFNTFRKVIYVDRFAPDVQLVFPATQTGSGDIAGPSYGFVVDNPDGTGNSMHFFWNLPPGTDPVDAGLLNGDNKATQTDRRRFRFTIDGLAPGDNQKLTIVLFEESGRYRLAEFNIGVSGTAGPTPTPSPTPVPTPTASATPTETPAPTASPSPSPTPGDSSLTIGWRPAVVRGVSASYDLIVANASSNDMRPDSFNLEVTWPDAAVDLSGTPASRIPADIAADYTFFADPLGATDPGREGWRITVFRAQTNLQNFRSGDAIANFPFDLVSDATISVAPAASGGTFNGASNLTPFTQFQSLTLTTGGNPSGYILR